MYNIGVEHDKIRIERRQKMVVTENMLERFGLSNPEEGAVRKYFGFPLSKAQEVTLVHMMSFDRTYLARLVINKISKKIGRLLERPK